MKPGVERVHSDVGGMQPLNVRLFREGTESASEAPIVMNRNAMSEKSLHSSL